MVDVSIFTPSLKLAGGAERYVVNLSRGLTSIGYQVEVVTQSVKGPFVSDLPNQVSVHTIDYPELPILGSFTSVQPLYSYFKRKEPNNFISVMNHANISSMIAKVASGTDTNMILTEHNNPKLLLSDKNPYKNKDKVIYKLAKYLYPRADFVVGVSEGVTNALKDLVPSTTNLTTIYNPVVSEDIKKRAENRPDHEFFECATPVIIGAKPEAQKNIPMLIKSFYQLIDKVDANLVIVGTGEESEFVRKQSDKLGISDSVDVCGFVSDIYPYLGSADIFASTSDWEGLPTIHIEALACGTPVVATDCPSGPREILRDGKYGSLVPTGDVERFSRALKETLDKPPNKSKLLERAEDFSISKSAMQYDSLLK